jgi:hypothetical protein
MNTEFSLLAWSAWTRDFPHDMKVPAECQQSEAPDAAVVPAMLRRRLNTLGRAAISQLLPLLPEDKSLPLIYCSQHGDIERTLSVLLDLGRGGSVSPKNFSLAVHNAICGVLSIHSKLTGPINAIAALDEGLVPLFIEAIGTLADFERVLCIICDVPLPDVYQSEKALPKEPYAACFLLSREPNAGLRLALSPGGDAATCDALLFGAFINDIERDELHLQHNKQGWTIRKI